MLVAPGSLRDAEILIHWILSVRPARCSLAPNRELSRQDTRVGDWFKSPLGHKSHDTDLRLCVLRVNSVRHYRGSRPWGFSSLFESVE